MSKPETFNSSLQELTNIVRRHPRSLWVPTVALTLVATLYAVVRPATWEASQALYARDEAAANAGRPGKFEHAEDMKTVQETLLELVKSRAVIASALAKIGPPANFDGEVSWPTDEAISALQNSIQLSPPKGAEFGRTEVFYLKVRDNDRERAIALAAAVCDQLQNSTQQLRDAKAQGMIDELSKGVGLADADLKASTTRLSDLEKRVGADLAELRILNESPSGDSDLRRTMIEIENELRQVRSTQDANEELRLLLVAAQKDPGSLLATPNRLLESQPALRRLKEGLVDAQLRSAQLLGTMSEQHPQVLAAEAAEREVADHLYDELDIAIRGLQVERRVSQERIAALEKKLGEARQRLEVLAGLRADYANLVEEVRQRTSNWKLAQQSLDEARASQVAARTTSIITRLDQPDTGNRPVGPGKTTMVLAGLVGGLVIGLGIIFLTYVPTSVVVKTAPSEPVFERLAAEVELAHGKTHKPALHELAKGKGGWN